MSRDHYQGVVGALFGIALAAAAIRTICRIFKERRMRLDDALAIVAAVTLITATVIFNVMIPKIYAPITKESVEAEPGHVSKAFRALQQINRLFFGYILLTWTTIYSVKFSFLCFFHQIFSRVRSFLILWRAVFAFTALSYCFCLALRAARELPLVAVFNISAHIT